MPKSYTPDTTPTSRRDAAPAGGVTSRRMLGFGAAALATVGFAGAAMAIAYSDQDDELIRLCATFDKLTAEYNATDFDVLPDTPEGERAAAEQARISDLQDELIDPICALRPTTLAGFLAVARALVLWDGECAKPDEAYCFINDRLKALLLRSMTEGA